MIEFSGKIGGATGEVDDPNESSNEACKSYTGGTG